MQHMRLPILETDDERQAGVIVQIDSYFDQIVHFYRAGANYYLLDIRYTFVFPEWLPIIKKKKSFDHRTLQGAFSKMQSFFLFLFCPEKVYKPFPEGFDRYNFYMDSWESFFRQEINILRKSEEFSENVCIAVAYQNTERGYEAENRLEEFMKNRYKIMLDN